MGLNNVTKKFEKARDNLGLVPDEKVLASCMTNPMSGVGRAAGSILDRR